MAACPAPVLYGEDLRRRAAAELEALPATSVLPAMIGDYLRLRAQAYACQEARADD